MLLNLVNQRRPPLFPVPWHMFTWLCASVPCAALASHVPPPPQDSGIKEPLWQQTLTLHPSTSTPEQPKHHPPPPETQTDENYNLFTHPCTLHPIPKSCLSLRFRRERTKSGTDDNTETRHWTPNKSEGTYNTRIQSETNKNKEDSLENSSTRMVEQEHTEPRAQEQAQTTYQGETLKSDRVDERLDRR